MTSVVIRSARRTGEAEVLSDYSARTDPTALSYPNGTVYGDSVGGERSSSPGANPHQGCAKHGGLSSARDRRARRVEHSVQRSLITEDGAVI